MRSPSLAASRYDRLVLAFGDSVLNGGALTDHEDLATTLASKTLSTESERVLVGNVSAGSWGPGNIRAWVDEFGFLGASTAIFVLSSHDVADHPTFAALNPTTHPTRDPPLALIEAVERYLPRYLPDQLAYLFRPKPKSNAPAHVLANNLSSGAKEIDALLASAKLAGVRVCLVQHLTQSELMNGSEFGFDEIGRLFRRRDVPSINLGKMLAARMQSGDPPYRDDIHINDSGQLVLAGVLAECDRVARVPS